jgi:site-specific DNA-methyltransferase (adenine-specific)
MSEAWRKEVKLMQGDCLEKLKELADNSLDSLVTDPPAGIGFMGKSWDHHKGGRDAWVSWMTEVMRECLRVLKPGAHGLVWAIPRTSHWTATALEDAGFEIRDVVTHLFGTGFPKSMDISKAIDKAAGAEREVVGELTRFDGKPAGKIKAMNGGSYSGNADSAGKRVGITAPASASAKQWQGWGTALKPAVEFWWLIRKPLSEKTVAANVLKWGCGGINVDECRISADMVAEGLACGRKRAPSNDPASGYKTSGRKPFVASTGRFPANLVLSHSAACFEDGCAPDCAVRLLDEQSLAGGMHSAGVAKTWLESRLTHKGGVKDFAEGTQDRTQNRFGDAGGASRFFYCAKASRTDRNRSVKDDRQEEQRASHSQSNEVDELFDSAGNPKRRQGA